MAVLIDRISTVQKLALAASIFVLALAAVNAHAEEGVAYIVRAETTETAAAAVRDVDGKIIRELRIINAVATTLSEAQVEKLRRDERVKSISRDGKLDTPGPSDD